MSLTEWDRRARYGLVSEYFYYRDHANTGIECPNMSNLGGTQCKAHLTDLPFTIVVNGETRRGVGCQVCGFVGSRAIAK